MSTRLHLGLPTALLLSLGCHDIARFDTTDSGAYCGQIIDGRFVRQGFERQLEAELELDLDRLQEFPGRLTTFDDDSGPCAPDPLFDRARLKVPQPILADPLSQLEFGDDRELNFLSWVESSCRGPFLAVVSLMKNDEVELRLLGPEENDGGTPMGFGVFQLKYREACGR